MLLETNHSKPRFARHVKSESGLQSLIPPSEVIDEYTREKMIEAVNEVIHPTVQQRVLISYIYQIQRQLYLSTIGDYYPAKKRCIADELVLMIDDMSFFFPWQSTHSSNE